MSFRENYYVFPRKLQSGKFIYYYQAYDDDGNLKSRKSTGKKTKASAKEYCRMLEKEGRLVTTKTKLGTLKLSDYLKKKCLKA